MSIIPSLGRRGSQTPPGGGASPLREEAIQRVWTFLRGLVAKSIRLTSGAASGYVLTSDASGSASWGNVVPHETSAGNDATANENGILVEDALGTYLITVYHECTVRDAGTLVTTITYTDDLGSQNVKPAADVSCVATGYASGSAVLRCTAGDIEFTKEITGGGGGEHYRSHITAVKISD